VTKVALAAQFSVNRDTVSACLQGPAFEALQEQFNQELGAAALARLKAYVLPATNAWCDSIDAAAQKGDHRPARDLLLHTKVIEPVQNGTDSGFTVRIGVAACDVNVGIAASPACQLTES